MKQLLFHAINVAKPEHMFNVEYCKVNLRGLGTLTLFPSKIAMHDKVPITACAS